MINGLTLAPWRLPRGEVKNVNMKWSVLQIIILSVDAIISADLNLLQSLILLQEFRKPRGVDYYN